MNELALFAGAGGGILGGKLLGWRTVCAVEWDAYARDVLVARQNDGCLEAFPIWDDVQTFDGHPWRGRVDVVSGGFPCQDISVANSSGVGITGAKSGMWVEMARIIGEVRPRFALVENAPTLTSRGLGTVLGDLARMGYDARWGVLGAIHAGAPHSRRRIWIVAQSRSERGRRECGATGNAQRSASGKQLPPLRHPHGTHGADRTDAASESPRDIQDADCQRRSEVVEPDQGGARSERPASEVVSSTRRWWIDEPGMGRMADGVANRTHRLRCLGNGQVPGVVPLAWNLLR